MPRGALQKRSPDAAGGFASVAAVFLLGLIGGVLVNFYLPFLIWSGIVIRVTGFLPLFLGVVLFDRLQFPREESYLR